MDAKSGYTTILLYLFAVVFLSCCKKEEPDPCPDPTNPECADDNPCYPNSCSEVVYETLNSAAIQSNLLGTSPERKISIYLPEGYENETARSYPVLYLLHGFTADHTTWYGGTVNHLYGENGMSVKKMLDTLIQKGVIEPLIVVCPNNYNHFDGSWYTNSVVMGNWEDFMVQEVVSFVDSNYRTLDVPQSRGIAGHSMGAEGAMRLAMKHPDVYSLVYALSGALEYAKTYLDLSRDEIIAANQVSSWNVFLDPFIKSKISRAIAYAPNPALSPFMGELPLNEQGVLIDSTWQKWLKHDPYSMLGDYSENLKSLKGIRFDCGSNDDANISCSNFSDALTLLDIDHVFESYSGDHSDKIPDRIVQKVLPFFSENLEHSK